MDTLFIGGNSDGERVNVPEDRSAYMMPGRQRYDRNILAAGQKRVTVYVYEELSMEDALGLLVSNYRRCRKCEEVPF